MLVLSRGVGERIQIGDQIEVVVVRIGPGLVRIGIQAPAEMPVMREEILFQTSPDKPTTVVPKLAGHRQAHPINNRAS
jgi:carbon storage regulator